MGLFDSFTGNKNPQTTDTDTPIITETAEVSPAPEVSLDPQTIEIQDTDILGGYTPSADISLETPLAPATPEQMSDDSSDILITPDIQITSTTQADVPLQTETPSIDSLATEVSQISENIPEITIDTPLETPEITLGADSLIGMETETQSNIDATPIVPEPPKTETPASTGTSLFDSLGTSDTEEITPSPIPSSLETAALGTAVALTMDDAIKTLEANIKTIKDNIKERKTVNADAIKDTKDAKADAIKKADDKLKELETEKKNIEADEKRVEEMEENLLATKKPTRRTTRKRTTRSTRSTPKK